MSDLKEAVAMIRASTQQIEALTADLRAREEVHRAVFEALAKALAERTGEDPMVVLVKMQLAALNLRAQRVYGGPSRNVSSAPRTTWVSITVKHVPGTAGIAT